jgi:hypothetical protein
MVTIRRDRMWHFLDRLMNLAIPRIKDFRGVKDTAFDASGSYSMGLNEQAVWPEINMANVTFTHGMNINIVFAEFQPGDEPFILQELGMPFVRKESGVSERQERRNRRILNFKSQIRIEPQQGTYMASKAKFAKMKRAAEVLDPQGQPVPDFRPGPRRVPEVRRQPHRPARTGPPGHGARHEKGQLVSCSVNGTQSEHQCLSKISPPTCSHGSATRFATAPRP